MSLAAPTVAAMALNTSDTTDTASNTADHPEKEHPEQDLPTISHEIAVNSARRSEEVIGGGVEVNPNTYPDEVSESIWEDCATDPFRSSVLGMSQEDVWTVIRRFNALVFRVTAVEGQTVRGLDVNTSKAAQSSPEHIQAHMARFYMTVMVSMFAVWKHVARLRSWKEWRRTLSFLFLYVMALLADQLGMAICAFFILLIISTSFRNIVFPFMPPSMVDSETGGAQESPNGISGTGHSITGAPENYDGEAVELEAQSFFSSLSKLIACALSDKPGPDQSSGDNPTSSMAKLSQKIDKMKDDIKSSAPNARQDQTEQPMTNAMEDFEVLKLMGTLLDFVDTWERVGNAICPTPLFQSRHSQLLLASCFAPFILVSMTCTRDAIFVSLEVLVGVLLFGEPIFREMRVYFDRHYPNWRESVQLRNTILREVPTNSQLAMTILRAGEKNKSPLLPQPISQHDPEPKTSVNESSRQKELIGETAEPGASAGPSTATQPPPDRVQRLIGFVKRTSKRGVKIANKIDEVKAKEGNENAQQRLDLGQTTSGGGAMAGPIQFPASYEGKNGYIYVVTTLGGPYVSWRTGAKAVEDIWTVQIDAIQSLSKVNSLSSTGQSLLRGVLDKDALEGIVITAKDGVRYHISKVVRRDVLFNRLIGLGNQIWELH